jgi:hypothetical protein
MVDGRLPIANRLSQIVERGLPLRSNRLKRHHAIGFGGQFDEAFRRRPLRVEPRQIGI